MLEVIDFMNEETHRRQIVTPKHNITEVQFELVELLCSCVFTNQF